MGLRIAEGDKWGSDDEGNALIPRRQAEYLESLLEGRYKTAAEAATALDIPLRTLRYWRTDPRFRAEWERQATERMVATDRIQSVVDVLYNAAVNAQDVQAAREYLKYVERFQPPRRVVEADREVEHLSDEELADEIARLLADPEVENG